ncbi:MAG: metal-dependent transcriptional regulator [Acidobacteriota bacterium]|nr:metal-dependent transcriptional regulator [Acidobacteriota bacterium]
MTAGHRPGRSTESVDNYLKAILALSEPHGGRVMSKALAERLGVAPASVTNMLQKLAAAPAPLVEYERHRGVLLSPAGRRRALEIVRHHRLIETFLYEVLDYPLEELHEEAERLEHFISERFEARIAAKLGHPRTDPHGHSIPTLEGEMPHRSSLLLAEVTPPPAGSASCVYVVDSVSDRDATALRNLEANGITPGARLRLLPGERFLVSLAEPATGDASAQPISLTREDAQEIWIRPLSA